MYLLALAIVVLTAWALALPTTVCVLAAFVALVGPAVTHHLHF